MRICSDVCDADKLYSSGLAIVVNDSLKEEESYSQALQQLLTIKDNLYDGISEQYQQIIDLYSFYEDGQNYWTKEDFGFLRKALKLVSSNGTNPRADEIIDEIEKKANNVKCWQT